MTDRIYQLIELAAICMMPGYGSWMDGIEHETEDWHDPSGGQRSVLDLELEHRVVSAQLHPQSNDGWWWEPTIGQEIDVLQRLVDLRDRKIRLDVPERRLENHPRCCLVWQLFGPEPPEDNPYGDIPF